MRYFLKSLFFSFLSVFFANHILPGIAVVDPTKLPHIGGDLPFAIALGLLNALIYPFLKMLDSHLSAVRIGFAAILLNFVVYALLKVVPIGIQISTWQGYLIPAALVTLVSFFINFYEMRHYRKCSLPSTPSGSSELKL
ncbi:MAG: phage holin family protein [Chlamydiia bacterium]|nr:phage holin family protein [Chlamydiia bacterium]